MAWPKGRPRTLDILGHRFGRLVVEAPAGVRIVGVQQKRAYWTCRCDCGATVDVMGKLLRNGSTSSCGCLRRDAVQYGLNFRHGHARNGAHSPEYVSWSAMLNRCHSPGATQYRHYGGRGIEVCEEWRTSFEAFVADMGPRPSTNHSIDRIDPNGNYEPGNCRWVTKRAQSLNRRNTIRVSWRGRTLTLAEWEAETGIGAEALRQRIAKGWDTERTFTQPQRKRSNV